MRTDVKNVVVLAVVIGVHLCLSVCNSSFGGSLTTLDGRSFEGDVKVASGDALVVSPKGGSTTRVELVNVLSASFISSSDAVPDVPMSKGIVMTDGSALACESLLRADMELIRLDVTGVDGRQIAVKTADVARIVLGMLSGELLKRVPPGGHSGVLLDGGDFVEGEFRGIDGGKVRISSVLFGLQSFDAGRHAIAVILHDAREPADAPMIVRLSNGSVLAAKSVSFERGTTAISVDERCFGKLVAPVKDLIDLRAGGERLVSLADLTPHVSKENSPDVKAHRLDATEWGTPPMLLGLSPRRCLGQSVGTSISFDLGEGTRYVSFVARAGVPAALVPAGRARFVVLVDGVERFRSEARTSVDDPVPVAVSLKGAKTLTLRVENGDATDAGKTASAGGAPGLWAEPLMVKSGPATAP
jgi:hypothetical protein